MYSPIQQKLDVYRFAILELYDEPFKALQWIEGPCYLANTLPAFLHEMLPGCPVWMLESAPPGTLIFSRLSHALRMRKKHPYLNMILIRPLFGKELPCQRIRKLVRLQIELPGLTPRDAEVPLRWGRKTQHHREVCIPYSNHPKILLLKLLKEPLDTLWPDETGTLFSQLKLGSNPPAVPIELRKRTEKFHENLRKIAIECLNPTSVWAVCSRDQNHLDWFQKDMYRLFPGKTHFLGPDDPLISTSSYCQFLLIQDSWFAWNQVSKETTNLLSGLIHLDTESFRIMFRNYRAGRVQKTKNPDWLVPATSQGWAELSVGNHHFQFERNQKEWFSACSSQRRGPNLTTEYYHRYKAFEFLNHSNKQISFSNDPWHSS